MKRSNVVLGVLALVFVASVRAAPVDEAAVGMAPERGAALLRHLCAQYTASSQSSSNRSAAHAEVQAAVQKGCAGINDVLPGESRNGPVTSVGPTGIDGSKISN